MRLFRFPFACWLLAAIGLFASVPDPSNLAAFRLVDKDLRLNLPLVITLIQDRKGFIWLGTANGLIRFDGTRMKTYPHDPSDPHTLSNNWVQSLFEDANGTIWVGTQGGLNGLNPDSGKVTRFLNDPNRENSLLSDRIWQILSDEKGLIWVATAAGLSCFDPSSDWRNHDLTFTNFRADKDKPGALGSPSTDALLLDREGTLWVGTFGAGLYRYQEDERRFEPFRLPSDRDGMPMTTKVKTLFQDSRGAIWIGTWTTGLFRFDPVSKAFTHFRNHKNDPNSISQDIVMSIAEDQQGRIWLGTHAEGLNCFDPQTQSFTRYKVEDSNQGMNIWITGLLVDRSGGLWVGGHQLLYLPNHRKNFKKFNIGPPLSESTVGEMALRFFVDGDQGLWTGTWGGGLHYYDPKSNLHRQYRNVPADTSSLGSNIVWAIAEAEPGFLWVGTNMSLDHFEKKTGRVFRTTVFNSNLKSSNISALLKDHKGRLWIGSYDSGLYMNEKPLSERTNFHLFEANPKDPEAMPSRFISTLLEDRDKRIWVGTFDAGLVCIEERNGKFRFKTFQHLDANGLSSNNVTSLLQDQKGRIWVGTDGGGINCLDPSNAQIKHYKKKDGLASDDVSCLLEDETGSLWVGTGNGLSRFQPESERFNNYDERDGLINSQISGPAIRLPKGELLFGSKKAVACFFPSEIHINPVPPPIFFTNFKKLNRDQELSTSLENMGEIKLSYLDSLIGFEFAALDFTIPDKNQYAYQLEGLGNERIALGNRNSVTFSQLQPGRYKLKVWGSNNDGIWNEAGTELNIRVTPAPWRTGWAYLIYALFALFMIWGYLNQQRQKLRRERLIGERLQEANTRLHEANQQLKLTDQIKDQFLANTSHELRTPLNGMIGLAENLLHETEQNLLPRQRDDLSTIITCGSRLAHLLNDILDFSKIKMAGLELRPQALDLRSLTQFVFSVSRPLLGNRQVSLVNSIPEDLPPALGDQGRVEQILQNLVGNAIKFTSMGSIEVSAQVTDRFVMMSITDSGCGIHPENILRIFESFEQVNGSVSRTHGGSGLGLAITKKLVELQGGEIGVHSEPGLGSTFYFTLPLAPLDCERASVRAEKSIEITQPLPEFGLENTEDLPEEATLIQAGVAKSAVPKTTDERLSILVVDDESVNLQVLEKTLSSEGYRVHSVSSGFEALQLYEQGQRFDLVLLDVMMPRLSGYEVCQTLRKNFSHQELPILLITARSQEKDLAEGFLSGANDYIIKPFGRTSLLLRIKTHLDLLEKSRSLRLSHVKLQETNRSLEAIVEARTRELSERNTELEALDGVVQSINREVAFSSVLQILLRGAMELAGKGTVAIFFLREGMGALHLSAIRFLGGEPPQNLSEGPYRESELCAWMGAQAWEQGIYERNCKPEAQRLTAPEGLRALGHFGGGLLMTTKIDTQVEGQLLLLESQGKSFNHHDLQRLQRLRNHITSALTKARILEELRLKNENLIKAQRQLLTQEKMAFLGMITTGIAHEIRNPLNFINNFSEVLVELCEELEDLRKTLTREEGGARLQELTQELETTASRIREHGLRASKIVQNITQHSEGVRRGPELLELNELLSAQIEILLQTRRAKGIESETVVFYKDLDPNGLTITGIAGNLAKVFLNLFQNALDSLQEKQADDSHFRPEIRVSTQDLGSEVELRIRDNGQGIPKNDFEKIFIPFFTTKGPGKGTGLGLSICFEIVTQEHHGKIEISSEMGIYTEFTVTFPKKVEILIHRPELSSE